MTSTNTASPNRAAAYRALECLTERLGLDPYRAAAEQTAMLGHYARAGGATAADFTGPTAIGLVAFTSTPTDLTAAALRMAAEHPDLEGYRRPRLHQAAADYLPAA